MSLAQLQTALDNLDTEIVTLSTQLADATSFTIEGLSVQRARMKELTEARKALLEAIAIDPTGTYEIHTQWVPTG